MPSNDFTPSTFKPKSMERRKARTALIIRLDQASFLGRALLDLRHAQWFLANGIKKAQNGELVALAGALCKVIEQRRVLLRLPGPPTGAALSRDEVIKLAHAEPVEAEQVAPSTPSPAASPDPGPTSTPDPGSTTPMQSA